MDEAKSANQDDDWQLPQVGHEFLHELAKDRLAAISRAVEQSDSKMPTVVGAGAAFLGITLSVLALREEAPPELSWVFIVVGGACFVLLLLTAALAYGPRDYEHGPKLDEAWEHALSAEFSDDALHAWAADIYTSAAKKNDKLMRDKAKAVDFAMVVLLAEFVELAIAVVVVI